MDKYESYKSSGVEWIGNIPINWIITKMKYGTQIVSSSIDKKEYEGYEKHLIIHYNDVIKNKKIYLNHITEFGYCNNSQFQSFKVLKGDIILTKDSMDIKNICDSSIVLDDLDNCVFGYHLYKLTSNKNKLISNFLYYFLNNKNTKNYFLVNSNGTTIIGVSKTSLENTPLILPPIYEQLQIVQFLDNKTELIDKLISTKERKITLLKEQRISLINQVVTKGLNPNVKMKDSGVEWIGEIPEHWVTLGFTKIIKIRHGYQFREYDFTDEGIKIVKITQLDKEGYLNLDNCSFINDNRLGEFERILIKENDVLMCLTGGTIGKIIKVGKVTEPLVQNYRVGHFSPLNKNISNDYVFWYMTSSLTTSQMFSEIRETGQPNIGMEDFGKMKVILPPLSEQIEIVKLLELKTKEIDDLVKLEQKKIDLLKEYRQSLISEVVTGKLKVTTDE